VYRRQYLVRLHRAQAADLPRVVPRAERRRRIPQRDPSGMLPHAVLGTDSLARLPGHRVPA